MTVKRIDDNAVVEILISKISQYCNESRDGHDFLHLKRVEERVIMLQKLYGGNLLCLRLAAYAHDLHRWLHCSPYECTDEVHEILKELPLSKEESELTELAIKEHETYALPKDNHLPLECKILQDADRLDALGVKGLKRTIMFGLSHGLPFYDDKIPFTRTIPYEDDLKDPSTMHHIFNKLLFLKEYMNTEEAKKIAEKETKIIEAFFNRMIDEHKPSSGDRKIKRYFENAKNKCCNGCLYCFSNFSDNVYETIPVENCEKETILIFYPLCDSELEFQDESFLETIFKRCEELPIKSVISISTKQFISDSNLKKIVDYNQRNKGKSIVKLTVSFTNMDHIGEIEPLTFSFEKRVEMIKTFLANNIPVCVFLKPLLPFIDFEEYKKMVDVLGQYVDSFVLGPLYVDTKSYFYKKYIENKYPIHRVLCEWMDEYANQVVDINYDLLKEYIKSQGLLALDSDTDFIKIMEQKGLI